MGERVGDEPLPQHLRDEGQRDEDRPAQAPCGTKGCGERRATGRRAKAVMVVLHAMSRAARLHPARS